MRMPIFRLLTCSALLAGSLNISAQTTTIVSEDFSSTDNIFGIESTEPVSGRAALLSSGLTGFGRVLSLCKANAECTITGRDGKAAQPGTQGAVTVEWDAFHGYYGKEQGATVSLLNSDGKELASYTYIAKSGQITAATIGGSAVTDFKAFTMQSRTASNGGANGFSGNGKPYTNLAGYNPHVSMTLTAQGRLLMAFTLRGATTVLKGEVGTLKKDVARLRIAGTVENTDRSYAIDNFTASVSDLPDAVTGEEAILNAAITGAESMTFGANTSTAYRNPLTLHIIGTEGSTINEQTAKNTPDFNITWDIEGFRTENDTEGQYCDSYGSFPTTSKGKTATTFDLRDVPMNFYGALTATITYNGQTVKTRKYVTALGNKQHEATQVLPRPGYPTDFSALPAILDGYCLIGSTDGNGHDPITGGWNAAGTDTPDARLMAADANHYIRLTATTAGKTHALSHATGNAEGQVIVDANVRFNNAGAQLIAGPQPYDGTGAQQATAVLHYDGTGLTLNGTALAAADGGNATIETGQWYRLILSADRNSRQCFARVYAADGKLLAKTDPMASRNANLNAFVSIGLDNATTGSVDIAACQAFTPTADTETFTLTADKTTLSIPAGDKARLSVAISDVNGYPITDKATWTIVEDDMRQSLVITPDANDSHQAILSLSDAADAGTATIRVNIGGTTAEVQVTVLGDGESIKFTEFERSITITFDDTQAAETRFAAQVVDGDGNVVDRAVALTAYAADGITPLTNNESISFDAATGILSVSASAKPTTIVIGASCKDSDGKDMLKKITVNIHETTYDFGNPGDEGYAPTTKFDVSITPGAFYTVEITYQGVLTTGYINSDLSGYELGSNATMKTATYTMPGTSNKLDFRVATNESIKDARIASITVTRQAKRQKRTKPRVMHIGDSTSANSGSWAYRLAGMATTFPELFDLCDFQNKGAGGRNLSTYYMQGKLADVLLNIYPGDIVMFGNNGTNGMGNSFEADVNYYLNAAEALGAKVILNSYTPHGAVSNYSSGYNSSTHKFNSYRQDSYDVSVRSIASQRAKKDSNYLGFVEIGKNADNAFNAYVADYAKNGHATADAAAQAIISCFTDHNHYSNGTLACDLMLKGYGDVKGIVEQLTDILKADKESATAIATVNTTPAANADAVYALNGTRVDSRQLAKGIYVIDGRKVVVK